MKSQGLSELAKLAGVSLTTASRALNRHPYVREDIRRRVFDAASQLNYRPGMVAKKRRIGVVVNDLEDSMNNFYRGALLQEISRQCGVRDIGVEIVSKSHIELLDENFLRVALIFQRDHDGALARIRNTRLIGVNAVASGIPDVSTDDMWCVERGLEYLTAGGCRRVAMAIVARDNSSGCERAECFRKLAPKFNLPWSEELLLEMRNLSGVESEIRRALNDEHADAIFVAGEDMAIHLNLALYRLGVRVPHDVSLLSFEAPGFSECLTPPHTTVGQDFAGLVAHALDLAEQILDGKEIPADHQVLLPGRFFERESVKSQSLIQKGRKNA